MSEDHFVYLIAKKCDDAGLVRPVKVGISSNPKKRLAQIQTGCPFPVELVHCFTCPAREVARHMERMFHETSAHKRLHGEWFDYPPRQALALLCLAFNIAFRVNLSGEDDALIEESLELCGVRAVEKALGIESPTMDS